MKPGSIREFDVENGPPTQPLMGAGRIASPAREWFSTSLYPSQERDNRQKKEGLKFSEVFSSRALASTHHLIRLLEFIQDIDLCQ